MKLVTITAIPYFLPFFAHGWYLDRRYRKWQGSFCYPNSSLVSRDPHVTGNPAEYNCFTRVCESAVCFKIFINCIVVNVTFSQCNQTGIWVWQQEKVFFFRSSDNVQGKQIGVKFRIEDACCTRQPNRWCPAFIPPPKWPILCRVGR